MTMKKSFFSLILILLTVSAQAQSSRHDSLAIIVIDRMSDVIGELESCSFKLLVGSDLQHSSKTNIKYFSEYEISMSGPNKLLVNGMGHGGHRRFLYNGSQLAYYSFDENNYGLIPAPSTTLEMIDSVNQHYDIDFPAGDFFYPAFTDDLLQQSDSLRFLGMERIGTEEYFHIISYGREMNMQFWIHSDSHHLPGMFSITYHRKEGSPQYIARFSDWQLNPKLPYAMFEFYPPPNARRLRIMSKNDR